MDLSMSLPSIVTSFIALFIVMDPFTSVPVFLSMTKKFNEKKKAESAKIAGLVATSVLLGFMLGGQLLLNLLGIRLESFQIAGGLLMLLISISFALGLHLGRTEKTPVEAIIIGVPLLSGPGTMLTALLLVNTLGFFNVFIACLLTCIASYGVLLLSGNIYKVLGKNGLEILSRVMGVLLAAYAVEFIRRGFGL